jgi:hypothetical protein
MRLSDLLDNEVVDHEGRSIGGVADVVLVQDGPLRGGPNASFRIAALIVVERRHFRLLGYERDLRPAVFRWLVRKAAGRTVRVEWDHVAEVTGERVRLKVAADGLTAHRRAHRTPTPHAR